MELPRIEKLWRKYRDRGFSAVAVEADRDRERAVKFIEEHELTMHMLENGEQNDVVYGLFRIDSFPTVYLIDADGRILFHYPCSDSRVDERTLEEELLELLAQ